MTTNAPKCKMGCKDLCILRTSQSASNPGREYWSCPNCEDFHSWVEKEKQYLTGERGPTCKCGVASISRTSQSAKNPGRKFWTCAARQGCKFFQWDETTPPSTSPLKSSSASAAADVDVVQCQKCAATLDEKFSDKKQEYYFACDVCNKFAKWKNGTPAAKKMSSSRPEFRPFLVDSATKDQLQRLMDIQPGDVSNPMYDSFEVQCAWTIKNPCQWSKLLELRDDLEMMSVPLSREEKKNSVTTSSASSSSSSSKKSSQDHQMREPFLEVAFELASGLAKDAKTPDKQLGDDASTNEVFLLHGTRPENLFSILFEGHDLQRAGKGSGSRFGEGIYFAEHAGKIDQYSTVDSKYDCSDDGPLAPLHRELYTAGFRHPENVCYALVCRVVLGSPEETNNGTTSLSGDHLFTLTQRNVLAASSSHSLITDLPGDKFSEFVIFDERAVFVEYLVAYKRIKYFCECVDEQGKGIPLERKTVTKRTLNFNRTFLVCNNCNYRRMLPLCKHGETAEAKVSQNGCPYYTCPYKNRDSKCDFWAMKSDNGATYNFSSTSSSSGSSAKRARYE